MAMKMLTLLCAVAVGFAQTPKNTEEPIKKAIAAELSEFATWCHSKKLDAEAKTILVEALEMDAANSKAKALLPKLGEISEESDKKAFESKLKATGKKVAAYYVQLFGQKHQPKDQESYDNYLLRALRYDPKGVEQVIDNEVIAAHKKGELERALRIGRDAEKISPRESRSKLLQEIELKLAETKAALRTASKHPLEYLLALPKGWNSKKKWHILVCCEGAGCNWQGCMNAYLENRGDRPFILITPLTFSNTNEIVKAKYNYPQEIIDEGSKNRLKWDEEGLLSVLEDLKREFNAEDKIFITGFSGGGLMTWRMIFRHPDMLAAAAPCCGNFYISSEVSQAPERENLPVHAYQGDKDEYINMLDQQWDAAKKLCDESGYKNVTREMVPGQGHGNFAKLILDFFSSQFKK